MGVRVLGVTLLLLVASAQAEKGPYRLAVMEFAGAGTASDPDSLGKGLQSMISTDLAQVAVFQLVERARLRDIQSELSLQQSSQVDKETAAQIGKLSGATHLLVGSVTVADGKTIRLDVRFITVAGGQVVLIDKSEGATARFFDLEKALVGKVVAAAGVKISKKEKADVNRTHTSDVEAFRTFSQGIALFDARKYAEAETQLKAAVERDQGFALASSTLTELQRVMSTLPSVSKGKEPGSPQQPRSCRPDPLFTTCLPEPSSTPNPTNPTTPQPGGNTGGGGGNTGGGGGCPQQGGAPNPVLFTGDANRHFTVVARGDFGEARCVTPCQLQLPPGKVQMNVSGPVKYTREFCVPSQPSSVVVNGRRISYLGVGAALGGAAVGMTAVTLAFLFYKTGSVTCDPICYGGGPTNTPFASAAPFTMALAIALTGPALMYLFQMGSNTAKMAIDAAGSKGARAPSGLRLTGIGIAPTTTGGQAALSFGF